MAEFEDEEEFEEELSPEEKLQIAQHYLLGSPPGQFHEVLSDVRKIISATVLTDSVATSIARVANLKTGKIVTAPSGNKVVVTAAAEIDASHYFDPSSGETYVLDHLKLTTSEEAVQSNQDETLELCRSTLQKAVNQYASSKYIAESSSGSVYARDGKITIAVTGEKVNLKNYWSGKWTSMWVLQINGNNAILSGEIKIHVHYFEDGNLQMQTTKTSPVATFVFSSENALADEVISRIQNTETTLHSGLEDMFTNMNGETFKSMRRIMPITRTKMEWNVNAVRMVRQVSTRK